MKTLTKIVLSLSCLTMLGGCFGRGEKPLTPTKIEYKVVIPGDEYYNCKEVALPDPEYLDDKQIAELINDLVAANRTCFNSKTANKQYLLTAQKILEERSDSKSYQSENPSR